MAALGRLGTQVVTETVETAVDFLKSLSNKTYYRGSREDVPFLQPNTFLTDSPQEASEYALMNPDQKQARQMGIQKVFDNARVFPVKIETGPIYEMGNPEHLKKLNRAAYELGQTKNIEEGPEFYFEMFGNRNEGFDARDRVQEALEHAGFDGIKTKFYNDYGPGDIENVMLFNPDGKVRSIWDKSLPDSLGALESLPKQIAKGE